MLLIQAKTKCRMHRVSGLGAKAPPKREDIVVPTRMLHQIVTPLCMCCMHVVVRVRACVRACVCACVRAWARAPPGIFGVLGGNGAALMHVGTPLHSVHLQRTETRRGLPCSSGGVFSGRFSCAFALVLAVANVCVCVCVCVHCMSALIQDSPCTANPPPPPHTAHVHSTHVRWTTITRLPSPDQSPPASQHPERPLKGNAAQGGLGDYLPTPPWGCSVGGHGWRSRREGLKGLCSRSGG